MATSERWPSPMAGPAWEAYRTAWNQLEAQTLAGLPEAVQRRVVRHPTVRAMHDYVCRRCRDGEVITVVAAVKVWLAVVKKATAVYAAHQQKEKAA